MRRQDFSFDLPPELIAQVPLAHRSASRLLVLDPVADTRVDSEFNALPDWLRPGDLLVFNETRVLPARLHGRKATGGRVEVLLERILAPRSALVQIRASRAPRVGAMLELPGGARGSVAARQAELFELHLDREVQPYFEAYGSVPLPPYIARPAEARDLDRYQTVFAREPGAVAAPTAGLHFDAPLLERLSEGGIAQSFLTLHVGLGTFGPMRCDRIEDHVLHSERYEIPESLCAAIEQTRRVGGRVVAVGTTVVRALESAAQSGALGPVSGETNLFIYAGFRFRVIDAMITNFHLPESSLLMLVAAFAGLEQTLAAYRHAVTQRYRFFSYGDAMFVTTGARPRATRAL
jgi:S-adenosylmethionine:tRNA ribosyltransferase-isomerase